MKILMVCLGNICRSPLAEGILRKKIEQHGLDVLVDSAGTSGLHRGEHPDERMQETAKKYGLNIGALTARQFTQHDFTNFDLIYAMDASNYQTILSLASTEEDRKKVKRILSELDGDTVRDVPDPYYGGEEGFIEVYQLLDAATDRIMKQLNKQY
jgi:protein-tyrosine phosphatase